VAFGASLCRSLACGRQALDQTYGGRVEDGYRFNTPIAGVTPNAALQAQSFRTPFYSETYRTGGGFALSYNARNATARWCGLQRGRRPKAEGTNPRVKCAEGAAGSAMGFE